MAVKVHQILSLKDSQILPGQLATLVKETPEMSHSSGCCGGGKM